MGRDVNDDKREGAFDPDATEPMGGPSAERKRLDDAWQPMPEAWLRIEPPDREYLLSYAPDAKQGTAPRGVLPLGRAGMLAAGGGVGKSWALVQLAVAVASGNKWLGTFEAKPGRVLLVLAEEEREEMQRRLYSAARELGDRARADVVRRVVPLAMAGQDVALMREGLPTAFAAELEAKLGEVASDEDPWRLVVLDPTSRFADADTEKDNAAATGFVQALERLTHVAGGPTVLCAHHTNKASSSGPTDSTAARGVSGLRDGVRWLANLEALAEPGQPGIQSDMAIFKVVKSNYTAPVPLLWLHRDDNGAMRRATQGEQDAHQAKVAAEKKKAKAPATSADTAPAAKPEDFAGDF